VQPKIKVIAQYLFIFGLTVALIWFSLSKLTVGEGEDKWTYLLATWNNADKFWLITMAVLALISHAIRAERWRMLLDASGHQTTFSGSLLSLLIGYLVNLVIPRGGEVSRCYNLYKLDRAPVEVSFGTVVVERLVDLVCLLALIATAFIVEADKLFAFLDSLAFEGGESAIGKKILVACIVLVVVSGIAFAIFRASPRVRSFVTKLWSGFREGILSAFRLKRKGLFATYSVLIWLLYFLMSYTVIQAFPETSRLGLDAVLSLFAIGAIAMAAPLPGGTGAYHVLVPQGLVFLYAIPLSEAVAFTFIFHAWQTAIMIAGGAVSLVVTALVMKSRARQRNENH